MNVCVVGAGHVGLVTAVCLAERGHDVLCVDADAEKVAAVNAGVATFHEPGLDELLRRNSAERLRATNDLRTAVQETDISLVAVPVPFERGVDKSLESLREVCTTIAEELRDRNGFHAVVVRSTTLPGTTSNLVAPLLAEGSGRTAGVDFGVGMNPEFLTEGTALNDFMKPDRLVLGAADPKTLDLLERLYSGFPGQRIRTNPTTAELIKLTSNALLATMISFSNELADLAEELGDVDIVDVMRGVHGSRYLTMPGDAGEQLTAPLTSYLEAGCGFGGSCLPKDVAGLTEFGGSVGKPMRLLEAVTAINRARGARLVDLLEHRLGTLAGARVTVLGLAFKPHTDDVRESPAFAVIDRLVSRGATVRVHDPIAQQSFLDLLAVPEVTGTRTLEEAVSTTDAIVIVTRWEDFERVPELLTRSDDPPLVVDGRRMLDRHSVARYAGVGLGADLSDRVDGAAG
jgi:UDPglucose 6-dehydrogenase/GDP-mannose 6-dehydrogenase